MELIKIKYKKILNKIIIENINNNVKLDKPIENINTNTYLLPYNCLCRNVYYYNTGWTCSCYLQRSL